MACSWRTTTNKEQDLAGGIKLTMSPGPDWQIEIVHLLLFFAMASSKTITPENTAMKLAP